MSNIPAFPTTEFYDEKIVGVAPGMTLRDYFAAKTLAVVAAIYPEKNYEQWATYAYHLADEMLKARESKP